MSNTSLKWPVLLIFMASYSLSYAPHLPQDEIFYYETARTWLTGRLDLDQTHIHIEQDRWFIQTGLDNKSYLTLPPGTALLLMPWIYMGMQWESMRGDPPTPYPQQMRQAYREKSTYTTKKKDKQQVHSHPIHPVERRWMQSPSVHMMYVFNIIVCCVLLWVFYVLCLELGASVRRGVWMVFALGLSTPLWVYATQMWTQTLMSLLLIMSLLNLIRFIKTQDTVLLWYIATICGLACWVRYDAILWVSIVYLSIGYFRYTKRSSIVDDQKINQKINQDREEDKSHTKWSTIVLTLVWPLGFPLGTALIAILCWNMWRFGNIVHTGSLHQKLGYFWGDHWSFALVFNLISTGQGLLIFVPLLCVSVWGWRALVNKSKLIGFSILAICFTQYVFYSFFVWYEQSSCWGPRFLLPIIPLLLLPLIFINLTSRWLKILTHTLLTIGVMIQAIAVLRPMNPHIIHMLLQNEASSTWAKLIEPSEILLCLYYGNWAKFWWTKSTGHGLIALVLLGILSLALYLLYQRAQKLSKFIEILK